MKLLNFIINKFGFGTDPNKGSHSFSQCGEDLIINFIFENYLKISKPSYLDIGAHHPIRISNTYFFYKKGGHGVCIEPDPSIFSILEKTRKRDICLNVGIGVGKEKAADFYVMTSSTLNTFSKEEAERYQNYGEKIERLIKVPVLTANSILNQHFKACPNLISIDTEGLEMKILESFDFETFQPEIFCIETLTYALDTTETKIYEIIEYMKSAGYIVYADTYINTIFVNKEAWEKRGLD